MTHFLHKVDVLDISNAKFIKYLSYILLGVVGKDVRNVKTNVID
jgi:hypothetical protein